MLRILGSLAILLVVSYSLAAQEKPFLSQEKSIPDKREWLREIGTKSGGKVLIKVKGNAPFSVTLVTDAAYQALMAGKNGKKEDILFSNDSKTNAFEHTAQLKQGKYWIIIENRSGNDAKFQLECFEKK